MFRKQRRRDTCLKKCLGKIFSNTQLLLFVVLDGSMLAETSIQNISLRKCDPSLQSLRVSYVTPTFPLFALTFV